MIRFNEFIGRRKKGIQNRLLFFIFLISFFIMTGCAGGKRSGYSSAMVSPKTLEPGLSVRYYYPFELNINYLPKGEEALKKGVAGKPILWLNHKFGRGEVFDSGRKQLVGMIMNGFINFPEPGPYRIKAKSNDGIRIIVDEKTIVNDPKGHADRFKTSSKFQIPKAGWYPLVVKYFQRKGTATIEVYWKTPGSEKFIIIPAEAYAHIPPGIP